MLLLLQLFSMTFTFTFTIILRKQSIGQNMCKEEKKHLKILIHDEDTMNYK